jgi:hypothetical protein
MIAKGFFLERYLKPLIVTHSGIDGHLNKFHDTPQELIEKQRLS